MKKKTRTPSKGIQSFLRQEVNFGCPVRYNDKTGCGSPILTFHHFDPPWAGNYIHNKDGMIALCPEHHRQADAGIWSINQFKEMKSIPFVDDQIKVRWPWMPENIVIKFGRSLVVGGGSPIRLNKKPIFEFSYEEIPKLNTKQICFTSNISDQNRMRWLNITNNIFNISLLNTTDLIFTPQTNNRQT